eukprot:1634639-Alexandrium_andersonii.AAC.1
MAAASAKRRASRAQAPCSGAKTPRQPKQGGARPALKTEACENWESTATGGPAQGGLRLATLSRASEPLLQADCA